MSFFLGRLSMKGVECLAMKPVCENKRGFVIIALIEHMAPH
jgi:hypothetical protein